MMLLEMGYLGGFDLAEFLRVGLMMRLVPFKKRHQRPFSCLYYVEGNSDKAKMYRPGREISTKNEHTDTLILNFAFQNYEKINLCYLSHSSIALSYVSLSWL